MKLTPRGEYALAALAVAVLLVLLALAGRVEGEVVYEDGSTSTGACVSGALCDDTGETS